MQYSKRRRRTWGQSTAPVQLLIPSSNFVVFAYDTKKEDREVYESSTIETEATPEPDDRHLVIKLALL